MNDREFMKRYGKKLKSEEDLDEAYAEIRRYCKQCGHSHYVLKQRKKIVCSYCGATVYYDDKEEFKDKLIKKMR